MPEQSQSVRQGETQFDGIMRIEIIDQYLAGEMTPNERLAFEQEMERDARLKEDVRITAYIIHDIKRVGLEEDNQRLQRLITSSKSDHRRYVATIATLFIMGLAFADIISIPIYKYVVKPIMESFFDTDNHEKGNDATFTTDTITTQEDIATPSTGKPKAAESTPEKQVTKSHTEEEMVSQVEEIEDDEPNEEEQDEQEPSHVQAVGNAQLVDFGENRTRYAIEGARMNGNTLTVTVAISNDDDDDIVYLEKISLVDSYGDTKDGYGPERFVLKRGTVVKKQLHFYNVTNRPDFLQILKMKEKEGTMLHFRNISIS